MEQQEKWHDGRDTIPTQGPATHVPDVYYTERFGSQNRTKGNTFFFFFYSLRAEMDQNTHQVFIPVCAPIRKIHALYLSCLPLYFKVKVEENLKILSYPKKHNREEIFQWGHQFW